MTTQAYQPGQGEAPPKPPKPEKAVKSEPSLLNVTQTKLYDKRLTDVKTVLMGKLSDLDESQDYLLSYLKPKEGEDLLAAIRELLKHAQIQAPSKWEIRQNGNTLLKINLEGNFDEPDLDTLFKQDCLVEATQAFHDRLKQLAKLREEVNFKAENIGTLIRTGKTTAEELEAAIDELEQMKFGEPDGA